MQCWACCAEERKSTSPQVCKLFFDAPQLKRRFSKAQLQSLRFKLLDELLIATFIYGFCMVNLFG
jgi:hypothetical protein